MFIKELCRESSVHICISSFVIIFLYHKRHYFEIWSCAQDHLFFSFVHSEMSTKRAGSRIPSVASFRDNSSELVNTGSRQRQSKRDEVSRIANILLFLTCFYKGNQKETRTGTFKEIWFKKGSTDEKDCGHCVCSASVTSIDSEGKYVGYRSVSVDGCKEK